ncbi:type II secretion system protein [Candidatus Saganbacteria bacterium]|nr:type II secretion system protein [Candidatus Saganbacteria bacterium]
MKSGFTLIESLLVFLLIGVLLSWATFNLSGITSRVKLSAAARMIASDLRAGQIKAPSTLVFGRDTYSVEGENRKLPGGVAVVRPITIKFSKTGSPLPGYFGTIELKCGESSLKIVVSNLGRVRVE